MSVITEPVPHARDAVGFAELGVPADLVRTLKARGIDAPFPIQTATLPDGIAGRDLSGRAPTGSGKTLAFGIPLAIRVSRAAPKRPTGLVLVPTRELANQVGEELRWLGHGRKLRVAAVYGGAGFGPQLRALRKGVEVLVACPGRLGDLIERGEVDLGAVEVVVVDEADRMADMGFLPAVRALLDLTPPDRQTLLYSAALDGAVDTLVRHYQRDPVRHLLAEEASAPSLARHHWWAVERDGRAQLCADVVRLAGPTIVFCRTKHGSDNVAKKLSRLGVRAQVIHGNRSQGQRERALAAFAAGTVDALVATDVVARGIHVDDVACVVNFDLPHDEKDYVHRAGRTARAGAAGSVVSLVPRDQVRDATKLGRALGQRIELEQPGRELLRSIIPSVTDARIAPETPAAPSPAVAVVATVPAQRPEPGRRAVAGDDRVARGSIKWYDARRGFGFISRGGSDDLFVHKSEITVPARKRIEPGQLVEFRVGQGRRGDEAQRVSFVSKGATARS
jgi:superfamily II DNA/RNA helicase/cold shock CspA family protein